MIADQVHLSDATIVVKLVGIENYYDSRPSASFTGITYGNVGNTLDGIYFFYIVVFDNLTNGATY